MKFTYIPVFLMTALLLACGGNSGTSSAPPKLAAQSFQTLGIQPPAAYVNVTQRIFVAYFGRPSDSSGLPFFNQLLSNANAPTDVAGIVQAYANNPTVRNIIDTFSNSDESKALYTGGTEAFVTAIYHNLFNREPDAGGKAFWISMIDGGFMTRANAAITIMGGANGSDITIVTNKAQAATNFTNALDTPAKIKGYDGLSANVIVRAMLAGVGETTDLNAFQTTINNTIDSLAAGVNKFSLVATIVANRCVACHSAKPTMPGTSTAPAGIRYDTEAQIREGAGLIFQTTVVSRSMPDGNLTNMTDGERQTISDWVTAGAP